MQIIYFPGNGKNIGVKIHPVLFLIGICMVLFLVIWGIINTFFMIIN